MSSTGLEPSGAVGSIILDKREEIMKRRIYFIMKVIQRNKQQTDKKKQKKNKNNSSCYRQRGKYCRVDGTDDKWERLVARYGSLNQFSSKDHFCSSLVLRVIDLFIFRFLTRLCFLCTEIVHINILQVAHTKQKLKVERNEKYTRIRLALVDLGWISHPIQEREWWWNTLIASCNSNA